MYVEMGKERLLGSARVLDHLGLDAIFSRFTMCSREETSVMLSWRRVVYGIAVDISAYVMIVPSPANPKFSSKAATVTHHKSCGQTAGLIVAHVFIPDALCVLTPGQISSSSGTYESSCGMTLFETVKFLLNMVSYNPQPLERPQTLAMNRRGWMARLSRVSDIQPFGRVGQQLRPSSTRPCISSRGIWPTGFGEGRRK